MLCCKRASAASCCPQLRQLVSVTQRRICTGRQQDGCEQNRPAGGVETGLHGVCIATVCAWLRAGNQLHLSIANVFTTPLPIDDLTFGQQSVLWGPGNHGHVVEAAHPGMQKRGAWRRWRRHLGHRHHGRRRGGDGPQARSSASGLRPMGSRCFQATMSCAKVASPAPWRRTGNGGGTASFRATWAGAERSALANSPIAGEAEAPEDFTASTVSPHRATPPTGGP